MMVFVEIVAFLAAIALGVLWIIYPRENWEPWLVLVVATTGFAADLVRRFRRRTKESQESSATLPILHFPKQKEELTSWLEDNVHTAKLSESLPRALQFAKRIGDTKLEKWIRLELYGYGEEGGMTEEDVVPQYRAVTGRWMDGYGGRLNLSDYPDLAIVNQYPLRFGVAQLGELASKEQMQNLADDDLINSLRKNMGVEVVRFCFSPIEVRGILDVIRNKFAEKVLDCLADTASNAD